jgi:arylsulfatase A-like enzyme
VTDRNLIVVVADTLRDTRTLGPEGPTLMPFLNDFAARGVMFPRLLASSSWTAPSHVSLLSGTDPWETHFHMPGQGRRPPTSESMADKWRKSDGVSAAFSANFLVAPQVGTATGYDRFNPGFPALPAGLAQLFVTQFGYERLLYQAMAKGGEPTSGPLARAWSSAARIGGTGLYKSINSMRSGDTLLRAFRRFVGHRPPAAKPLHLFFNLAEAHEPYLVGQNGGSPGAAIGDGHLPSINWARFTDLLDHRNRPSPFAEAYRASLREVDRLFARLVGEFRRAGLLDNTVLAFLSDHGQNLGEHGYYGHGFYLYDELVKIPGYLWEFRDGKPLEISTPPDQWVDHRHVFDMLSSVSPAGAPLDPFISLQESLLRRGPAASYFEGPGPRPPDGPVIKSKRPAPYRIVRIQRDEEVAMVGSDVDGSHLRSESCDSPDPVSPELAEIGRGILATLARKSLLAQAASTPGMDAAVDARLKSWGYD